MTVGLPLQRSSTAGSRGKCAASLHHPRALDRDVGNKAWQCVTARGTTGGAVDSTGTQAKAGSSRQPQHLPRHHTECTMHLAASASAQHMRESCTELRSPLQLLSPTLPGMLTADIPQSHGNACHYSMLAQRKVHLIPRSHPQHNSCICLQQHYRPTHKLPAAYLVPLIRVQQYDNARLASRHTLQVIQAGDAAGAGHHLYQRGAAAGHDVLLMHTSMHSTSFARAQAQPARCVRCRVQNALQALIALIDCTDDVLSLRLRQAPSTAAGCVRQRAYPQLCTSVSCMSAQCHTAVGRHLVGWWRRA